MKTETEYKTPIIPDAEEMLTDASDCLYLAENIEGIIGKQSQDYLSKSAGILTKLVEKIKEKIIPTENAVKVPECNDYSKERIQKMVARYFNTNVDNLSIRSRKREVVLPRQICMYLLKENTSMSHKSIGELLGGLGHTASMHSVQTVKDLMDTDYIIRGDVEFLQARI